MIIKIAVYDRNQYLKSGKLKKKAQVDFGRTLIDVGTTKKSVQTNFTKETAQELKKDYAGFKSPYFFTHIEAVKISTGEPVYIYEDVTINGHKFITSPTKLLEALTK